MRVGFRESSFYLRVRLDFTIIGKHVRGSGIEIAGHPLVGLSEDRVPDPRLLFTLLLNNP